MRKCPILCSKPACQIGIWGLVGTGGNVFSTGKRLRAAPSWRTMFSFCPCYSKYEDDGARLTVSGRPPGNGIQDFLPSTSSTSCTLEGTYSLSVQLQLMTSYYPKASAR